MKTAMVFPRIATAFFGISLLMAVFSGGCSRIGAISIQERMGWSGSNLPGHMKYQYTYFTGKEQARMKASAGQFIELTYQTFVSGGKLTLQILDPDQEVVWDQVLEKNADETIYLEVEGEGTYRIQAIGDAASGGFDLSWKVN